MAVNYSQFLDAAESYIKGSTEIDFRNAASRAYYSAFHLCKTIAPDTPFGGGTHEKVIRDLQTEPKTRSVAFMLIQCRDLRVNADYFINESFREKDAEQAIASAKRIIARVSEATKSDV